MPCCEHTKELLNRLARAQGHLNKVSAMVKNDEYCIDIITQSLAVQSALSKIDEIILQKHLHTCVKDAMVSNTNVDEKISEIIKTFRFVRK